MLNPRHIIITGASSGLGAALAYAYAAAGVRLSLHGRDASRLAVVAAGAKQRGADVSIKIGDVVDSVTMAAWIAECDRFRPIDLVIANAGISAGGGQGQESPQQARDVFEVNLTGVLNTVQPAIPLMASRRRGQIALISSLASFGGFAGAPAYCASKAAVRVYGESLRGGLKAEGIEVNVICPGFIKTPMTDSNPFPMPFIITADRAAEAIKAGLARNQGRIAFPLGMYLLVRLAAALPQDWVHNTTAGLPRKPPKS